MTQFQDVFLDETGASGPNLLDPDQPYFAYAAVAIDRQDADALLRSVRDDMRIRALEFKGRQLLRTENGRSAMLRIADTCLSKCHFALHNKGYALACKFFEYVFEPVLSEVSALFYGSAFHIFVARLLYSAHLNNSDCGLLRSFHDWMRQGSGHTPQFLSLLAALRNETSLSPILRSIVLFILENLEQIIGEHGDIHSTRDSATWTLELTSTSVFWLLMNVGSKGSALRVFCDASHPATSFVRLFERTPPGEPMGMGGSHFTLAGSIQLVDSQAHSGVQIADVMATVLVSTLEASAKRRAWISALMARITDRIIEQSIVEPQNLTDHQSKTCSWILNELVSRTMARRSVLSDWPQQMHLAGVHWMRKHAGS